QRRASSHAEQRGTGLPGRQHLHGRCDRRGRLQPRTEALAPAEVVEFLELPKRSEKPRDQGITHVLDRGLSVADIDSMVEVAGASIDIVKLGWGTAIATGNLERKLERYRHHGLPVVLGGTLTELAISQHKLDRLIGWVRDLGLRHFEISDGTIVL